MVMAPFFCERSNKLLAMRVWAERACSPLRVEASSYASSQLVMDMPSPQNCAGQRNTQGANKCILAKHNA
eukprot:1876248-Alexandrium_andersonii.AAC.1